MTEAAEELTQKRGSRSGEMTKLGGLGTAAEYHARHVRWLRNLPASKISDQERQDHLDAAEYMTAYLDGDPGVTREAAKLAEIRALAKWFLKRVPLPMTEFPEDLSAVAYARGRYCIEVEHEKPEASEGALRAVGAGQYAFWYRPIRDYFSELVRLLCALRLLGDRSDEPTCRQLFAKGHSLAEWLAVRSDTERELPVNAHDIPFLPRFLVRSTPGDRWWWGDWKTGGSNVLVWWERFTA